MLDARARKPPSCANPDHIGAKRRVRIPALPSKTQCDSPHKPSFNAPNVADNEPNGDGGSEGAGAGAGEGEDNGKGKGCGPNHNAVLMGLRLGERGAITPDG